MKKTLCLLILSFIFSTNNNIFSQVLSGNCPQKEITREICRVGDSLARFMDYMKKSSSYDAWSQFVEDAGTDSTEAFNNFGERSSNLKDTFMLLGDSLDKYTMQLIEVIDPLGALTSQLVRDSIFSLISCYYADTIENNYKKLFADAGEPFPEVLAPGPCESAGRSCLSTASQNYHSNLIQCGFGGGAIAGFKGGWWGAVAGFGCFVFANISYNNAKMTCFEIYIDCIG